MTWSAAERDVWSWALRQFSLVSKGRRSGTGRPLRKPAMPRVATVGLVKIVRSVGIAKERVPLRRLDEEGTNGERYDSCDDVDVLLLLLLSSCVFEAVR